MDKVMAKRFELEAKQAEIDALIMSDFNDFTEEDRDYLETLDLHTLDNLIDEDYLERQNQGCAFNEEC